ncbi:MAG: hypothetical protein EOP54_08545 [Sphingobacteriales bacterium]|nr:MAG: hypothetical protein EOP54_08545 [Sphingobacteriales bacterium]
MWFIKGSALKSKLAGSPFIWLTAIATVYEFTGTIMLEIESNYWFHFYILLEFVALHYFFSKLLRPQFNIFFKTTLLLFVVFYIVSCFPAGYFIASSITKTMTPLFVITGSTLWIRKLFIEMKVPNLWKNSDFYFVSGFLLYYTSTFFFFLLSDSIFNLNSNFYDYWLVNIIAAFIFRILLSIGTWQMRSN